MKSEIFFKEGYTNQNEQNDDAITLSKFTSLNIRNGYLAVRFPTVIFGYDHARILFDRSGAIVLQTEQNFPTS